MCVLIKKQICLLKNKYVIYNANLLLQKSKLLSILVTAKCAVEVHFAFFIRTADVEFLFNTFTFLFVACRVNKVAHAG